MLEVVTPEQQKFTPENEIKLVVAFQKTKGQIKDFKFMLFILIPHVEFKQYEYLSFHNFYTDIFFLSENTVKRCL